MKDAIISFLIVLEIIFALSGTFLSTGGSFQVTAQTISDFPIEQHVWKRTGWLIHYDWGLTAYIYLNNSIFYYMIAGGSEFYQIWISLDPSVSDGFQINGMSVDYVLSTVGPEDRTSSNAGLHKWSASEEKWKPVVIANMTEYGQSGAVRHSSDGSVAFSANQGKVALSKIGYPDRIWLVLEVNEVGPIRVPQNGFSYLDITNMFAAVFTVYKDIGPIPHPGWAFPPEPQSWVINRFETANATVFFRNYGTNTIQNMQINMSVPPEIRVLKGSLQWSTSLGPFKNATHTIQMNRTSFGTSILNVSFTYNADQAEATGPITLQQKLTMVPRVSLNITAPQETLLWMQEYPIDLTIENLDPYAVTVDLTYGYAQNGHIVTLNLHPLANITLYPQVKIKNRNVGCAVFFEDSRLDWATTSVNFTYPDIQISEVLIDSAQYNLGYVTMEVGKMYTLQSTIQNEENASYSVTFILKEGSYSQKLSHADIHLTPDYSTQTVELPPKSNTTITSEFFILDKPENGKYTKLSLAIEVDQAYLRGAEVLIELVDPPGPSITLETILVCVLIFFVGIFVGVFAKIVYDVSSRRIELEKNQTTAAAREVMVHEF